MDLHFPEGKSIALLRVGEKGQIVIPKDMREMFGIQPGGRLLAIADVDRGIALLPPEALAVPDRLLGLAKEAEKHDDPVG